MIIFDKKDYIKIGVYKYKYLNFVLVLILIDYDIHFYFCHFNVPPTIITQSIIIDFSIAPSSIIPLLY